MDSGNSDSFQSSNGGDEEYNSLGGGDSISALIHQAATGASGGLIYNTPPHQPTNHSMFNNPMISNYQNLQNNLEMVWSEPLRSDPNSNETNNPLSSHQQFTVQNSNIPSSSSVQEMMNNTSSRTSSSLLLANPKKRSRASRRAPTTVLTTDTSNFRAMVQEFTGIPAPPFTSSTTSSLFSRNSRLDNLFGKTSSMRSNSSNPLDYSISLSSHQAPSYLARPFPQKFQPSSSSSLMVDSLRSNNVDDSYQRLQSSNLFTMQNPILASLLQSNPSNPTLSNNLSVFGSKTHHGSGQIQSSSNGFQVEGNNSSLGALPGLVSADPARWGGGNGGANGSFGNNNNGGGGDLARNVGNGKRQKGMMEDGGVGARSEGMMETWICSSSE